MGVVVVLALMVAVPATVAGMLWVVDGLPSWELPRRRRAAASGPPVERLAADLRRLARHLDVEARSDHPAKAFRLQAASNAYDETLLLAARALQVPAQGRPDQLRHGPLTPAERLQTEAELAMAGLSW
jgi:hypothetical protein